MNDIKGIVRSASDKIEGLYDAVQALLFGGATTQRALCSEFLCNCGISPESRMTKMEYEKIRDVICDSHTNKCLYWYDMELKIESLADRIAAVESLYLDFDFKLPHIDCIDDSMIECARIDISEWADDAYVAANNVFVAIAAGLDILAKIAYEVSHVEEYDFSSYKRMKSDDILFKQGLPIDDKFKKCGMVFSEMPSIRLIEAFRNEYVHNSSWSYRATVYEATDKAGNLLPRYMMFPDYDERGFFIKSGTRGHFYSQGNKINEKMPDIIVPVLRAIENTVEAMIEFCYDKAKAMSATVTKLG